MQQMVGEYNNRRSAAGCFEPAVWQLDLSSNDQKQAFVQKTAEQTQFQKYCLQAVLNSL
jgi:hypothetical protein